MIGFCREIREDGAGLSRDELVGERRTYAAVRLNLILLGEAATHVPDEVQSRHPEVPWREMVGTRNRLIHGYPGVDDGIVWRIVSTEIPVLEPALRRVLDRSTMNRP